jgi:hypothetical protein
MACIMDGFKAQGMDRKTIKPVKFIDPQARH